MAWPDMLSSEYISPSNETRRSCELNEVIYFCAYIALLRLRILARYGLPGINNCFIENVPV
jgi:hypothetical protein